MRSRGTISQPTPSDVGLRLAGRRVRDSHVVPKKWIMVVHGTPDVNEAVGKALPGNRYRVLTVANFQEFEMQIRNVIPDLVILDMYPPIMNGVDVLRAVKLGYPGLPVITIVDEHLEDLIYLSVTAGARGLLHKPLDPSKLVKMVHQELFRS